MKKTLLLLAMGFFAFIAEVEAEYKFNVLNPGDPLYGEYQAGLCETTYQTYLRFNSDRYWLDYLDPKMGAMSPARREAWVEDYVVTTELRDTTLQVFDANCR